MSAVTSAPEQSIAETIAAKSSVPVPTAADFRLLLDLRERITDYLDAAADEWYRRNKDAFTICGGEWPWISEYDAKEVTLAYYADNRDRLDFRESHHRIPMAELFPSFAEEHAVLTALAGSAG